MVSDDSAGTGLDTVIGGSTRDSARAATLVAEARACEQDGDRAGAIDAYRRAIECDDAAETMFRLAYLLDLSGEEDDALQLYEELANREDPPINALLNLAVLYEDRVQWVRAEKCLRQILDTDPNHERARLFMKDVLASKDMLYDEENDRDRLRRDALLDTPVTDFELSVRARNCLKKMQIRTLGDLLKITEAELLSYKNFGETSLTEIKEMLQAKGLRLGQGLEGGAYSRVRKDIIEQLRGKAPEAVLNKSISALELSVRARKALQLLNIQSIGELAARTEAELMGVKNFGSTSLDEIKVKLADFGLGLRTLEEAAATGD
ncbi:MAG: DNA-directed RNA polymerase subunit alpha C-terminal domain-containing protein [Planctomycetota bacterium]|jgi:DNA-directed RNA polymerase subunit alpha